MTTDTMPAWRPEVVAFADLMEKRLREKDEQRGGSSWKRGETGAMLAFCAGEAHRDAELFKSAVGGIANMPREATGPERAHARQRGADMANFAMIVLDVAGELRPTVGQAIRGQLGPILDGAFASIELGKDISSTVTFDVTGEPFALTIRRDQGERDLAAWRATAEGGTADGTRESLAIVAQSLETYGPECFPADEQGKISFERALFDAGAIEIRAFLAATETRHGE